MAGSRGPSVVRGLGIAPFALFPEIPPSFTGLLWFTPLFSASEQLLGRDAALGALRVSRRGCCCGVCPQRCSETVRVPRGHVPNNEGTCGWQREVTSAEQRRARARDWVRVERVVGDGRWAEVFGEGGLWWVPLPSPLLRPGSCYTVS